jgi:cytochrome oxidase Cu insertion factor (SCO1/SenC/PrrC family)
MGRWLATAGIAALFALNLALPSLPIAKQGAEASVRSEASDAVAAPGRPLPAFELVDLDGAPIRLADLRGHRVLLTFERSLDW